MNNVLVIGSINYDTSIVVDRIPVSGETIKSTKIEYHYGGKGANQAVASSKSGTTTYLIGALGDDAEGAELKQSLINSSVNINGIIEKKALVTGQAFITVAENGDNAIIVVPGANDNLSIEDISKNKYLFKEAKVLLIQLEIPMKTVEYSLKVAKEMGLITILNPAPAAHISLDLYKYIDILTPNEKELDILVGMDESKSYSEKAMTLIDKGVKSVIVTLGEKGAVEINKEYIKSYSSFKSKVIDTTGAGDCFNGYLASSLAQGKTIEEAIIYANKGASLSVTKKGAQNSIPTKEEVETYFREV
ncbi:ribokinase [Candidatus Clostridium radicumherbarum]|uniref:Ribokinase n=1 Tax=Candidatus Clostridium radicumherbarum TaxID=3381662 RepID=A0ABW8TT58_9CLOT